MTRRPPGFRPSLMTLEGRWLPTASPYPDAARNALASSYAVEAATESHPVVFLGDSITYLWGSSTVAAPGSASFRADFAPLAAANFGIIGDTTSNLRDRVDGGVLAGQPKVAVVMIGINNLIGGGTAESAASGVSSVVHAIRAESPTTQVLVLSILPTGLIPFNSTIAQADSMISRLVAEPNVTYLDLQSSFLGSNGAARAGLLYDGVHPSAAGYQVIDAKIHGEVVALLKSSPSTPASTQPAGVSSGVSGSTTSTASIAPEPIVYAILPDPTPTPHKTAPGKLAVGPRD